MPSYSEPCLQLGGTAQDDLGGLQPPEPPPRSAPGVHVCYHLVLTQGDTNASAPHQIVHVNCRYSVA